MLSHGDAAISLIGFVKYREAKGIAHHHGSLDNPSCGYRGNMDVHSSFIDHGPEGYFTEATGHTLNV